MITDDAYRVSWIQGINSVSGKPNIDIRRWLSTGTFQVEPASTPENIIIRPGTFSDCLRALAGDINRIAMGADETCSSIVGVPNLPRSMAWLIIKIYYAAFFSAHAIIRTQGVSCSNIDVIDIIQLRRIANVYGMAHSSAIASGQYKISFNASSKTMTLTRPDKLRAHEFLWKTTIEQIDFMKTQLAKGFFPTSYVEDMEKVFGMLEATLSDNGRLNGNWLSQIRNKVNYRQEYDVWYPYKTTHLAQEWVDKLNLSLDGKIEINPSASPDVVRRFLETSISIIASCRGTLQDLSSKCTNGKSFLVYGPKAFINFTKQVIA
jgi:hypothetical protein